MELAWLYTALALLVATLIFLLKNKKPEVDAGAAARPAPVQAGPGGRRQPRRLRQQVIFHVPKLLFCIMSQKNMPRKKSKTSVFVFSAMETTSRSYQLIMTTMKPSNDQEQPPPHVSTPMARKLARRKRENLKKKKTKEFSEKSRPVRGRRRNREKKS